MQVYLRDGTRHGLTHRQAGGRGGGGGWRGLLLLLAGWLTSQQHASVSQRRICEDNYTCCHTEIEVADPTVYLTLSHSILTPGQPRPCTDPVKLSRPVGQSLNLLFSSHYHNLPEDRSPPPPPLTPRPLPHGSRERGGGGGRPLPEGLRGSIKVTSINYPPRFISHLCTNYPLKSFRLVLTDTGPPKEVPRNNPTRKRGQSDMLHMWSPGRGPPRWPSG